MSKIAFISDIHGNLPALKAVLEDCKLQKVEQVYCLGDLVGYYSQINEVINLVRDNGIKTIMGNHDYAMVHNKGVIERSRTCTNVLTRQLTYITPENLEYVSKLPDSMSIVDGAYKILCVHGGLFNHIDEYVKELNDDYLAQLPADITHLVTAHNHFVCIKDFKNVKYANSGSVGQPRDHHPYASYITFENGNFEIHRVAYDVDETYNKMKENGFPEYIAEVLYKGFRIGE